MKLLLIDTSTPTYRVFLADDRRVIAKQTTTSRTKRAAKILRSIETLCTKASWEIKDLNAVGWVAGPGGFTGLRLGATIANGIGWAFNIPVCGISWFEILGYVHSGDKAADIVLANPRGDFFHAHYKANSINKPNLIKTKKDLPKSKFLISNDSSLKPQILVEDLMRSPYQTAFYELTKLRAKSTKSYQLSLPLYIRPAVS